MNTFSTYIVTGTFSGIDELFRGAFVPNKFNLEALKEIFVCGLGGEIRGGLSTVVFLFPNRMWDVSCFNLFQRKLFELGLSREDHVEQDNALEGLLEDILEDNNEGNLNGATIAGVRDGLTILTQRMLGKRVRIEFKPVLRLMYGY